jgi:hypothetical protein
VSGNGYPPRSGNQRGLTYRKRLVAVSGAFVTQIKTKRFPAHLNAVRPRADRHVRLAATTAGVSTRPVHTTLEGSTVRDIPL